MARKTSPMKHRPSPRPRQRSYRVMFERGDVAWGVIIAMVIGVVLMVGLIFMFLRSLGPVDQVLSPTEAKTKDSLCYLNKNLPKSCTPSDIDKDGDCMPDSCDYCIDPNAKEPAKNAKERQAWGSDLFDKDGDGLPDLCDSEPNNIKVSKCKAGPDGKCQIPPRYYTTDESSRRTEIQIASLGTQEKSVNDLLFPYA